MLPKHLNYYLSADFAITYDAGDFSEIGVWGVDKDRICYAVDWWYGQTESDVWVDKTIEFIAKYKPLYLFGENGNIDKSVGPFLRKQMIETNHRTVIKLFSMAGDKASKARAFQGLQANRQVRWPKTAWAARVIDQLKKFPTGKYDDAVDACAAFGRGIEFVWSASEPKNERNRVKQIQHPEGIYVADLMPKDGLTLG